MSSLSSVASELGAFLAGKKTYILSGITLAADVYLLYTGQVTVDQAFAVGAGALGFSSLRHGQTTDVIKAATAIIATRDPAIAANPNMAAVNGIAKAIIGGALDHAQEAATPPAPVVQLTPAAATAAAAAIAPTDDSKHTGPLDQPAVQPQP